MSHRRVSNNPLGHLLLWKHNSLQAIRHQIMGYGCKILSWDCVLWILFKDHLSYFVMTIALRNFLIIIRLRGSQSLWLSNSWLWRKEFRLNNWQLHWYKLYDCRSVYQGITTQAVPWACGSYEYCFCYTGCLITFSGSLYI